MTTSQGEGYTAIIWDERTYLPYCAISKSDCEEQIGFVNNDKKDKVYAYGNYSTNEWIINAYVMDSAMLYKEQDVTEIPDGLSSEYDWNIKNLDTIKHIANRLHFSHCLFTARGKNRRNKV